jgi:hypothetical protein
MSINSLPRTKLALVAIALCVGSMAETAQAGNAFMEQIEATRTATETAFATQWCSDPVFVKQIAAAPFKYVGKHVCLQGYVGQPYAESEFILHDAWPPGNQSYEYQQSPPIVIKADARDLSQFQYVEIYGTVVKPEPRKNAEGGSTLFAVVKASVVDDNFLGMGRRPKGSTMTPSSSFVPPSTSRFADAKSLGS